MRYFFSLHTKKVAEAVPVRGTASMADRLEAIARNQSASGGATSGGSTKMKFHTDPHSYGSYCLRQVFVKCST